MNNDDIHEEAPAHINGAHQSTTQPPGRGRSRRRNREEIADLLDQWTQSQLSASEFGNQIGVCAQTLYRWRHQSQAELTDSPLLRIVPSDVHTSDQPHMTLILTSGCRIELPLQLPAGILAGILRESSCSM